MYDLGLFRLLILQPLTTYVFGILMSALIMALLGMMLWRSFAPLPPAEVSPSVRKPDVFVPFPEDDIPLPVLPVPERKGRAPVPGLV